MTCCANIAWHKIVVCGRSICCHLLSISSCICLHATDLLVEHHISHVLQTTSIHPEMRPNITADQYRESTTPHDDVEWKFEWDLHRISFKRVMRSDALMKLMPPEDRTSNYDVLCFFVDSDCAIPVLFAREDGSVLYAFKMFFPKYREWWVSIGK